MSRHLWRFYKSIQRLGPRCGSVVFYLYVAHRLLRARKWQARQVQLPGVSRPIWLRPGVSDWIVMERIFLDREYDPISKDHDASMDRLAQGIVARGRRPLIIDCGANVGLSSVWLSERFPQAVVVAIEPEPENFRILALNAGNFPNVVPVQAAVSDRAARVTLSNEGDTPWAWRARESESGGIPTVTIQQIVERDPRHELMAVKVDIEGFEVNLFRDGAAWVDRLPLLVFEMHDWLQPWSGSGHSFFSTLAKSRRDYLVQGENVFSYSHSVLAAR